MGADRPASIPDETLRAWVRAAARLRDNNPMLFMYGADDAAAGRDAEVYYHKALAAEGDRDLLPIRQTFLFPVAKTRLSGMNLLGLDGRRFDPLPEATVLEYLAARQEVRVGVARKTRNYVTPYYVDLNYYLGLR